MLTRRIISYASCAVAIAMLCAPTGARARQVPAPATGLIVGHAVDQNGAALSGVTVTLARAAAAAAGQTPMVPQRVLADASGGFVFSAIRPGTYTLTAAKPGYAEGALGRRRPGGATTVLELADGKAITDVRLPLWKFAAIAGTITDETGEPVVGVTVRVLRRAPVAGRARFVAAASVTTDDRGAYRAASLVPGTYLVAVPSTQTTLPAGIADEYQLMSGSLVPRSFSVENMTITPPGASTNVRLGEFVLQPSSLAPIPPNSDGSSRPAGYPIIFYPVGTGPAAATVITLAPGQDRAGTDIRIRAVPTVRVSGTLTGPSGPIAQQRLRLVSQSIDDMASEVGFETAVAISDSRGGFTFLGVPPGQYRLLVLKAQLPPPTTIHTVEHEPSEPARLVLSPASAEPTLWANEPVSVGDVDVTVALTLQVGARVSGRLEFEGASARLAPNVMAQIPVVLEPADGRASATFRPASEPAGAFATAGVAGGRYLLRVPIALPGWWFKAAMLDGRDISESPFELLSADVSGVILTFTDKTTQFSGVVTNSSGAPDSEAIVLIFPTDRAGWVDFGSTPRRIRSVRASRTGAFSTSDLPVGTYFAVAINDADAGEWPDARFLDALSRLATRVTLAEGQKLPLDLRTVSVR